MSEVLPAFIPPNAVENPKRRKMLIAGTSAFAGAGAVMAGFPFVASWQPSERAKAIAAPVEVDISQLEVGALLTVLWQGKVVFILKRSPEMLESLNKVKDFLRDPDSKESSQPEKLTAPARAIKEDILVMLGICTHFGCAPSMHNAVEGKAAFGDNSWEGGFFCACHGSKFDYSGRVYKGVPAPTNLTIPPYRFKSDTVIIIGEEETQNG